MPLDGRGLAVPAAGAGGTRCARAAASDVFTPAAFSADMTSQVVRERPVQAGR